MTSNLESKLVLPRKDGADYTLRFTPGNVEVLYLGSEISDYLRRGFVPQDDESLSELDSRIEQNNRLREERLESDEYAKVPTHISRHFEEKYGNQVCEHIVTRTRSRLGGACASFDLNETGVGEVMIPPQDSPESDIKEMFLSALGHTFGYTPLDYWEHELVHAAMKDNPCMAFLFSRQSKRSRRLDNFYLPVPCRENDSSISFIESAPPAFIPHHQYMQEIKAREPLSMMGGWAAAATLTSLPFAILGLAGLGIGALGALPLATWTVSTLMRKKRKQWIHAYMDHDIMVMSDLKERLGDPEALKLLAFMDRDMLRETIDYIEQENIRF